MGKYEPLGDFLRKQRTSIVPMTFEDIERVTGATLPPKAQFQRAWWSNNPSNNVMTKVWLGAGFQTEQVDIAARKLVFRRVREATPSGPEAPVTPALSSGKRHPLFGALKGLVKIMPGTDLTKPADPTWGEQQ
jgi:hypothetical protein